MRFVGNYRFKGKLLQVDIVLCGQLVGHDENEAVFVERFVSFLEKLDVGLLEGWDPLQNFVPPLKLKTRRCNDE